MSQHLVCITNSMAHTRPCTIRGQHYTDCDTTQRPCNGCLPRPASNGLLCFHCWDKVQNAYAAWPAFANTIASRLAINERAMQHDNGGIRTSPDGHVPIPGTHLAINECESYLSSCTSTIAQWVSNYHGATDAIHFAKAAEATYRTHPIEEKPHRINRTRCTKCNQLTLIWTPPAWAGDRVTVTCQNEDCGLELDQRSFEHIADIEEGPKRKKPAA